MNKILKTSLTFVAMAQLVNAQISTQQVSGRINTITTSVPFLMISPDSRAGGMGETGVSTAPDVNAIHWNSSKLAFMEKKFGFGVSYTPWLRHLVSDINLAYISGYYKLDKMQYVGGSLRYFSLGNIQFTDIQGNNTGQFRPSEFALDGTYGRKLSENFSMGMAARFIYSNLTGNINANGTNSKPGSTFAVDINGYYKNPKIELGGKKSELTFGFNVSNLGGKISYTNSGTKQSKNYIPINLRLGSGLTLIPDQFNRVSFNLEFNKLLTPTSPIYDTTFVNGERKILKGKDPYRPVIQGVMGSFTDAPDGIKEELKEINICTGLEYWYANQFALRTGYFWESATKGNRKFFTLGAGVKYSTFQLDFAYLIPTTQNNPLQNTLRFSMLFTFPADEKKVAASE